MASRRCGSCGHNLMERFEDESLTVGYAGAHEAIDHLSGWRCGACGEVEFDRESADRYAAGVGLARP